MPDFPDPLLFENRLNSLRSISCCTSFHLAYVAASYAILLDHGSDFPCQSTYPNHSLKVGYFHPQYQNFWKKKKSLEARLCLAPVGYTVCCGYAVTTKASKQLFCNKLTTSALATCIQPLWSLFGPCSRQQNFHVLQGATRISRFANAKK